MSTGFSTIDVSMVAGDPLPVGGCAGDDVIDGSVNAPGSLLVEATRRARLEGLGVLYVRTT